MIPYKNIGAALLLLAAASVTSPASASTVLDAATDWDSGVVVHTGLGASFTDTYEFTAASAVGFAEYLSASVHVNLPKVDIADLKVYWHGSVVGAPESYKLPILSGITDYVLTVTGTVSGSTSGKYEVSIEGVPVSGPIPTPIPSAIVLFGSVLVGAGLLTRRRRATA
jgi:hypothetical protein